MERNSGLRALLTRPQIYEAFQRCLGASHVRRVLVERYLRVEPGDRILDIGCGPGELANWVGDADYVGFDPSERYITSARARFGDRAQFHVGDVRDADPAVLGRFNKVIAQGVLHHLDDAAAARLFDISARVLTDEGRLITFDPCFSPRQSFVSRAIVARDRGGNVRTVEGYRGLAERSFTDVRVDEYHDLLPIPFSHAVLESAGAIIARDDGQRTRPT